MPDVDVPKSWSLPLQGAFWTGAGPASPIKGRWRVEIFGTRIIWLDDEARDYWGRIVQDPDVYPSVPSYPVPPATGDDRFCGRCGAQVAAADVFCRACSSRLQ